MRHYVWILGLIFSTCIFHFVSSQTNCPNNWLPNDGKCWYFSFQKQTTLSWTAAESWCQTNGGNLASFATVAQRDWVVDQNLELMDETRWWIGLNDLQTEGTYRWSDGSPYDSSVSNWKPLEPNNAYLENCVEVWIEKTGLTQVNDKQWNDKSCNSAQSFVCKKDPGEVTSSCPSGYQLNSGRCYSVSSGSLQWPEAQQDCRNQGANLVSVSNANEQTIVENLVAASYDSFWIGLSDTATPGTLNWVDATSSSYFNWASGQSASQLPYQGSSCVDMEYSLSYKWTVDKCSTEKRYICERGLKADCPPGWLYLESSGKCYEFVVNPDRVHTWTTAKEICSGYGGGLLKIESLEEETFVGGVLELYSVNGHPLVYFGLSDLGHDDSLTWWDQSTISTYYWAENMPAYNPGRDDCGALYSGKSNNNWETVTCFEPRAFICELPEGQSLPSVPIITVEGKCKDKWRHFNNNKKCYLFAEEEKTQVDAESYCVGEGGHLTSILTDDEISFIIGNLRSDSWIGLKRTGSSLGWVDNEAVGMLNWASGEPNNDGDCVTMSSKSGEWGDRPCSEMVTFVCKQNEIPTDTATIAPPTYEPDVEKCGGNGWISNPASDRCYKVNMDQRTWSDARAACMAGGGDLGSMNSPEENAFVNSLIKEIPTDNWFWIGGSDQNGYNIDLLDQGWRWSDGSPFNFIFWDSGEPNNVEYEDCMFIYGTKNGAWNDDDCYKYHPSVCEKRGNMDNIVGQDVTDDNCNSNEACCFKHLGAEYGGPLPDSAMSASTERDQWFTADRGRLNTPSDVIITDVEGGVSYGNGHGAWSPQFDDPNKWLQVDLPYHAEVKGIITQGRNGIIIYQERQWVTKYKVSYSQDAAGGIWEFVSDSDGNPVEFKGNSDQDTQVTNLFPRPVVARHVRCHPTEWFDAPCMRLEYIGCKTSCLKKLGMNSGLIPDNMITASTSKSGMEAKQARAPVDTDECLPSSGDSGANYRGWISKTESDLTCQAWSSQEPHRHTITSESNPTAGLINNYCRNPNSRDKPWCYTTDPNVEWQYCKIPVCPSYTPTGWAPSTASTNQYVQVQFSTFFKLSGVTLYSPPGSAYVKTYMLSFSDSGSEGSFRVYQNQNGDNQIFTGLDGTISEYTDILREPISTQYVRLMPQTWTGQPVMQFELNGCYVDNRITCSDTGNVWKDQTSTVEVNCPAGCVEDQDKGIVYGTDTYTLSSAVCPAAVHAGKVLNSHGGSVNWKQQLGISSYTGTFRNGITSLDFGPTSASFVFAGDTLRCDDGWLAWQNHCYYLSVENVKKTWHEARSHCLSMNGDLVSITSDGENSFIESQIYVADLGGDVWIGLNDIDIENYYQWSDGSPVVLTRWFWDEPKSGKHRCVNMYRFESYWNDKDCEETLPYMCKKEKELLPPPSTDTSPVDEGCDAGWSAYESSCYKASSDEYIFVYANRICEESQAKLVSIQNDFEQAFVHSLVLSTIPSGLGYTSWIGLTAKTSELGSLYYEWENGEPVQYTHWDKDEPDVRFSCAFPFIYKGVSYDTCITNDHPAGLENRPWCSVDKIYRGAWINCDTGYEYGCTYLDDKTGFWKIEVCGQNMYYVCEKPRAGYTQPVYTTPVITGTCAPGWYGDDTTSYCYQINESNDVTMRLNWFDAVDFCRAQGADLVSIHSATEEEALWNLVSQEGVYSYVYFWIGITAQDESAGYEWTDGSPVDYTNWDYGEPNDNDGNEKCGEAGLTWYSYWNDLNCNELRNWACKIAKNKDPLPPPTLPPPEGEENSPDCGFDENWIKYTTDYGTEKCYAFIDAYTFGWAYAEKNCTEKGGHLVAIHSQDENFFILSRATRTFATVFWIGLKDTAGLDGRSFTWADGSILDYVNWVDGEPNNFEDQEDCAEMHTNSGQWNDDNCGIMNNFICEKYVGSSAVTVGPTPNIMGGCPAGFVPYGNKCWMFGLEKLSWDDAVERCNNLSAAAAVIQNSHEQAFFTSQLRSVGQNVWIGMSGQISYIYTWQDQSEITYTNWNEFEPNGYYDDTCVEVSSSTETAGKWADTYCTDLKYFTCYAMRSSSYPDTTTPSVDCPTGYVRWGDACYKLVKQESTWDVAQAACQQEGSDVYLASITDVYENNLFKSWFWKDITSSDSVWIGLLFNATTSINDKGESSTTITLAWEDGWPVDYTNWAAGEPNSDFLVTGSACAMLSRSGYWMTMPPSACSTTSTAYVCKKLLVPVPTTFPPPTQGNCDPGFISSENYCYYIEPGLSSANYRSWHEAVYECQSRGATLASFHSLDECKQIVGAVIDIASHNMFIGLSSNGYDGWQWVDGSGVDFFNWGSGEPNGQGNGEDCVEMYPWDGKWNDVDCFNPRGYICKKAQDSSACGGLDPENRIDCGYVGIEESVCLRRSCCWDSTFMNANFSGCYYPTGNGSSNVPTGLPVTEPTGNKGGLETGAIIGIVIAVIAVIVIVWVAVYCTRSDKATDLSMPSMPSMPSLPTSWSISKSKPTADDKVGFENPVISIDHAMESDT